MFVKRSWNPKLKNPKIHKQLVESYWDKEKKRSSHRTIVNITEWPEEVVRAVELALKGKALVEPQTLSFTTGDPCRGAGLFTIAVWWKKLGMDQVLSDFSEPARQSVFLMVAQRILEPGSKLSLKRSLADTLHARTWSATRFDEDTLYHVMDEVTDAFYSIQTGLDNVSEASHQLLLYDITSTYFEGQTAEGSAYGYSRDKRWDRYQIVIGLVSDERGIPRAVEVWPGSTADKSTVACQVQDLTERFGITQAILVGDKGMYSQANLKSLADQGFDFILGVDWREQRDQLLKRTPRQLELFDTQVVEWTEGKSRYVGCASPERAHRDFTRRERAMETVNDELTRLQSGARKGSYYSQVRLYAKVSDLLDQHGVKRYWEIRIDPLVPGIDPTRKTRLQLTFSRNQTELERAALLDGKYVLKTSVKSDVMDAETVADSYHTLQRVERAFRHIKSFFRIRPIYHRLNRRIRAHVLICFLAYFLVKHLELSFRELGEQREVELVLRYWDKLRLCEHFVEAQGYRSKAWRWQMGELGQSIQKEMKALQIWSDVDHHQHSLLQLIS